MGYGEPIQIICQTLALPQIGGWVLVTLSVMQLLSSLLTSKIPYGTFKNKRNLDLVERNLSIREI